MGSAEGEGGGVEGTGGRSGGEETPAPAFGGVVARGSATARIAVVGAWARSCVDDATGCASGAGEAVASARAGALTFAGGLGGAEIAGAG